MRILHVTDCFLPRLGGLEVQVHQLSQQQARAGHRVAVLTATGARRGDHGRSVTRDGEVPVFRVAARVPGGLPVHPNPLPHARDLLEGLSPDVVHLHIGGLTPSTQAVAALLATAGRPAVVTVHSVWRPTTMRAYRALDRLVGWSRWPLHLTAVSHLAASRVRAAAGGRREVGVLRNGVDVEEWRRAAAPATGEAVHVVSAGRFARRKRMLPLLAALEEAARLTGGAGLTVTIPGEGPELPAARAFVAEHGLGDRVRLPGRLEREELVELYRSADAYVAPGVDDAFSVAVQEAQAAGLAIVSRSQSGAAELIEDGVSGLLADDDAALARAVARLVTDRALLRSITAHNRSVPPRTEWPQVLEQTQLAYETARTLSRRVR